MSLFFSSNKMWFLVSYLPTFSDDVTLFTVFFLKASLTEKYRGKIDDMKKLFGNNDPEEISEQRENVIYKTNNKYNNDLYYIALFYHVGLPEEIEKLIALDIDLRFR